MIISHILSATTLFAFLVATYHVHLPLSPHFDLALHRNKFKKPTWYNGAPVETAPIVSPCSPTARLVARASPSSDPVKEFKGRRFVR